MKWWYQLNPRKIFLIDAIGALVSALLLFLVVGRVQPSFGISYDTIFSLAIIACNYFFFSLYSYLFLYKKPFRYLKMIALLNGLYSVLILVLFYHEFNTLAPLGKLYMIGDAAIVFAIATAEYMYIRKRATTSL